MTLLTTAFAQGTHAARPAASASNNGFYYYETDTTNLFQSTGSAWQQIASTGGGGGGAVTQLSISTLAAPAANFDISAISSAYNHLELWLLLRGTKAATVTNVRVRLNADSAANYDQQELFGGGGTAGADASAGQTFAFMGNANAASATAGSFSFLRLVIPFYKGTTAHKVFTAYGGTFITEGTTTSYASVVETGLWRSTAAVTEITVFPDANNWDTGSAYVLYGVN